MLGVDMIGKCVGPVIGTGVRSSRDLSVYRATVRKVLASDTTEFLFDRRTQPPPKIGPWQSELEEILGKNAFRTKRERMTLMRIAVLAKENGAVHLA